MFPAQGLALGYQALLVPLYYWQTTVFLGHHCLVTLSGTPRSFLLQVFWTSAGPLYYWQMWPSLLLADDVFEALIVASLVSVS